MAEDPYAQTIASMGRDVYQRMLAALETGRWPDGRVLTPEQRAHTMAAVIAWGERHLPPEERVGFIDKGKKAGEQCDEPEPLKWREGDL